VRNTGKQKHNWVPQKKYVGGDGAPRGRERIHRHVPGVGVGSMGRLSASGGAGVGWQHWEGLKSWPCGDSLGKKGRTRGETRQVGRRRGGNTAPVGHASSSLPARGCGKVRVSQQPFLHGRTPKGKGS
jgi:hypothetical protein